MIVLLTCTPSLKEIWPGSTIEMRSMRHLWPLCWCYGPGLCVYGRRRRACFVNEYTERDRSRMYGLAWPSPHVNLTRACMIQTLKTYKCSASSITDAGWPRKRAHFGLGKNVSSAIRKVIRSFSCMCTVVFDTKSGQALYLLNSVCDLKHVTVIFVKTIAPPTDMQTFKFR